MRKKRIRHFPSPRTPLYAVLICLLTGLLGSAYAVEEQTSRYPSVKELIPVGHTVGVKLFADGVMVVDFSREAEGKTPAEESGLQIGDVITACNDVKITSTEQFQELLQNSKGTDVKLSVEHDGEERMLTATAEKESDGVYRLGAWIRDSMAGIGTVTFYEPKSGVFGALGHGISDVDTAELMPLEKGFVMASTVKAVQKGTAGTPGELRGRFDLNEDSGVLQANTEQGVFGRMQNIGCIGTLGQAIPIAAPEEVKAGKATILANCTGDEVCEYEVEIEKVFSPDDNERSLLLHVTDKRLLSQTGGIVQGMSGSPIIQNGKFVGAVTHVLVNDPSRGYGIFVNHMLRAAGFAQS